jgi:hypothetical protein
VDMFSCARPAEEMEGAWMPLFVAAAAVLDMESARQREAGVPNGGEVDEGRAYGRASDGGCPIGGVWCVRDGEDGVVHGCILVVSSQGAAACPQWCAFLAPYLLDRHEC